MHATHAHKIPTQELEAGEAEGVTARENTRILELLEAHATAHHLVEQLERELSSRRPIFHRGDREAEAERVVCWWK